MKSKIIIIRNIVVKILARDCKNISNIHSLVEVHKLVICIFKNKKARYPGSNLRVRTTKVIGRTTFAFII
jgi:hypothetical protein